MQTYLYYCQHCSQDGPIVKTFVRFIVIVLFSLKLNAKSKVAVVLWVKGTCRAFTSLTLF